MIVGIQGKKKKEEKHQTVDYFLFAFPKREFSKQSGWQQTNKKRRKEKKRENTGLSAR